jgi:hypothetical protein
MLSSPWIAVVSAILLVLKPSITTATSQWEKFQHTVLVTRDFIAGSRRSEGRTLQQHVGLTVIGGGFPRTGTKSIDAALGALGHRVYDTRSIIQHGHEHRWVQATEDWKVRDDYTALEALVADVEADGYTATLDMPVHLLAEPLAKIRPHAKVLLSVRDSVDQWYHSFLFINRFFEPFLHCRPWIWFMPDFSFPTPILQHVLGKTLPVVRDNPTFISRIWPWYDVVHTSPLEMPEQRQQWMAAYESFNEHLVASVVPPDRLLVYNVKMGWEPLLSFLNVPEDQRPALLERGFPHVNERASLERMRQVMRVFAWSFPLSLVLMLVLVAYALRVTFRSLQWCWNASIAVVVASPKEKLE